MSPVRDLRRRDAAQEEQRPAERRRQERGLQVHADQHRQPDQVDVLAATNTGRNSGTAM